MGEFLLIVAGILIPFFVAIYWVGRIWRKNGDKDK